MLYLQDYLQKERDVYILNFGGAVLHSETEQYKGDLKRDVFSYPQNRTMS